MKFFTLHVLRKPWVVPGLIKPPRTQRLPDVITIEEARRIFAATRVPSYRVFFFTLYSLGLRLIGRMLNPEKRFPGGISRMYFLRRGVPRGASTALVRQSG